jgi:hypothetical protein
MNFVIQWIFKTVLGRWVTAGLVALLLGGAALKWHNFKEDLIHKGQQVCVQEINKQTVIDLQNALAAERATAIELRALAVASAEASQQAIARRQAVELNFTALQTQMAEQAKTDETYKAWADTPLPAGVGERLRNQAAAGN